jgi:hypothetical protein
MTAAIFEKKQSVSEKKPLFFDKIERLPFSSLKFEDWIFYKKPKTGKLSDFQQNQSFWVFKTKIWILDGFDRFCWYSQFLLNWYGPIFITISIFQSFGLD